MKQTALYIVGALLFGCASPPAEPLKLLTRARVESFIVKGKTTKTEIIKEFGWPSSTTTMSLSMPNVNPNAIPYETIAYSKVYSIFPSEIATLMVQLNRKEIVVGYMFSNSGVLTEGVKPIKAR